MNQAVHNVLRVGQFILGPEVAAFEHEVADYLNVKHAIGVASGTDALVIALRALGIGAGDEVIVPAFTFFATAEAVLLVGAVPVFVDVDPLTLCLDVKLIRDRVTARTKAVIPVHLYGHPADMIALAELTADLGLKLVEDCAQSFGAELCARKTGTFGDIGCFSFFPTKNLGACGDAGMLVTNDDELAEKIKMLRTHGWREKYKPELVGYNSRLDELQAAILRIKLRHLDRWNERRRELANLYAEFLADLPVILPYQSPVGKHVYHLFVIRVRERETVRQHLAKQGIATGVYYPSPLHLLEPCGHLGYACGDFPVAEMASRKALALPLYPELTPADIQQVSAALGQVTQTLNQTTCESSLS